MLLFAIASYSEIYVPEAERFISIFQTFLQQVIHLTEFIWKLL